MNTIAFARLLGWFSLALGTTEIALPAILSRQLGLSGGPWLVRAFGGREIAAGLTVLAKPEHVVGPAFRVTGDVLDIAVLAAALSSRNPRHGSARIAFALVLGVTAIDILYASSLAIGERRRLRTARRTQVASSERVVRT